MALTLTPFTRVVPLKGNEFLLTVSLKGVGDGTGGQSSAVFDLDPIILPQDRLTLLDCVAVTNDANAAQILYYLTQTDWEAIEAPSSAINSLPVLAAGTGQSVVLASGLYTTNRNHYCVNYPFYLGRKIGATAYVTTYFNANTNSALYAALWRFIISRTGDIPQPPINPLPPRIATSFPKGTLFAH